MSLVIHAINKQRYVYDHHRVGNKIKSTYLGREDKVLIKNNISSSGYPVNSPNYPAAHKTADKRELSEYGRSRWERVERLAEKTPKSELMGTHNGTITVSKKVPEQYRGQVLYHEKQEKELMDGK